MESKNCAQKNPPLGTPRVRLEQEQHAGTGTQHVPVCKGEVPPFQPLLSAELGRTAPQSLQYPRIITATDRANFKVSHILSKRILYCKQHRSFYMTCHAHV